jgi:putative membrane protein
MNRRPALAIALLAATLGLAAQAQEKDSQGGTATDAGFFKNAGASGLAEVAASQLALKQSSSAKVKSFAQTMVDDHTRANKELDDLKSGDKGYALADSPGPDSQKIIDAMSRLQGAEFDKAYAKTMVADHEKAVAIFETEIEKGSNPQLKAFAKKTLPTLKHHLKMAKALP